MTVATSDVPEDVLQSLTRSGAKMAAYRVDPYFRHGVHRISVETVLSTTFLVLKPDAIAGRRVSKILDALAAADFEPVDAWAFTFTPSLIRELWWYQYNVASLARVELVDLLLPSSESLFLLLRDRRWDPGELPAACRLTALKGPADPRRRRPGDLRAILDAPTRQFNFFHTADEPADVVRELAALEMACGQEILGRPMHLSALARRPVEEIVARLYAGVDEHDLDCEASWRRLAACEDEQVSALARRALEGERGGWGPLLALFRDGGEAGEMLWDVLSIATAELPHNLPDPQPLIPTFGSDAAAWLATSGSPPE
ncbi:MAG TPA: nucleoside-diphosphate kinase [Solirubrobacterales bacterium]|nr:nucleoside-diphosphate kinase [Solirubrobacterales bacterium]